MSKQDDIIKKLREEVIDETPDILDELMKECAFSEETGCAEIMELSPKKPRRKVYWAAAFLTAAAAILLCGVLLYQSGLRHGAQQELERMTAEAAAPEPAGPKETIIALTETKQESGPAEPVCAAIVSLDVNPSLEMSVDESAHVISWTAVNDDAKRIVEGLDLKGSDVKVASYALVGAMVTKGYLNEEVNSILISVISADDEKGRALWQSLSEDLNGYLEESAIHAAVFGQYAGEDEQIRSFAEANGISRGKAWLIRRLISENPHRTEEALLTLSTQELLLLWEKDPETDQNEDAVSYGSVSLTRYVSEETAAAAAFESLGISRGEAGEPEIEFDCENGIIIYEVTFVHAGILYEVEVNAVTGEVVGYETDGETRDPAQDEPDDEDLYEEADDDPDSDDIYEEADDDPDDDDIYEEADDDPDGDDIYEEADDDRDDDESDNDND